MKIRDDMEEDYSLHVLLFPCGAWERENEKIFSPQMVAPALHAPALPFADKQPFFIWQNEDQLLNLQVKLAGSVIL